MTRRRKQSGSPAPRGSARERPVEQQLSPLEPSVRASWWLAGGLAVVVVIVGLVHAPALTAKAVCYDDLRHVRRNPLVQNPSLSSARKIFAEVLEPSTGGYYKPLSIFTLMLDRARADGPDDVAPFRYTSWGLHLANTVLIGLLLYVLFGRPIPAVLIALLFGVHPLTVESIPWMAERKNLLAAFFSLTALLVYCRYVRRPGGGWYAAVTGLLILALLSKPTATPLPVLLLVLDYWPLRRLSRKTVLEKIPWLVIAAGFAVITMISQSASATFETPDEQTAGPLPLAIVHNLGFYLLKIVYPHPLSAHYPIPEPFALTNAAVFGRVVAALVVIAGVLVSWRRARALVAGFAFFVIAILPTLGVIGFTHVLVADRFVYLPAVGLCLIGAWALGGLWSRPLKRGSLSVRRAAIVVVMVALAGGCSLVTRQYLTVWQNGESFYRHMLVLAPDVGLLHRGLDAALRQQGGIDQELGRLEQQCRDQLAARPADPALYNQLANVLMRQQRLDEAKHHFEQVIRYAPDHLAAHLNLGAILLGQRDFAAAINHLQRALQLDPPPSDAAYLHNNLGVAFLEQGQVDQAIEHFEQALAFDSKYEMAHGNLANALVKKDRLDEAAEHYRRSLQLKPRQAATRVNLARVLARQGQRDQAVEHYQEALAIQPKLAAAHFGLGPGVG